MNAQNHTSTNQPLDLKQQSIVSIFELTAVGDIKNLKAELNTGLDLGLTINEIKELLVQLYAYCGFPRSLNGIKAFKAFTETQLLYSFDLIEKHIGTNQAAIAREALSKSIMTK